MLRLSGSSTSTGSAMVRWDVVVSGNDNGLVADRGGQGKGKGKGGEDGGEWDPVGGVFEV